MKTCQFCNREIPSDANLCPYCGRRVHEPVFDKQPHRPYENPNDTGGCGWTALGFFFPVVGLILYLIWQTERPNSAKAAGKGALISVILSIIPFIIFMIALFTGSFFNGYQLLLETVDLPSISAIL
ncbi:MAG: zinc ribbon domain-containing protein [Bacillota bacterium]